MIADSPRKLAGQVLVGGFPGPAPDTALLRAAAQAELAGFVLFKRNLAGIEAVAELNRELLAAFPEALPPLIAVDQEGGRVQRLGPPVLQLPPMRELGALDDPALTEALGEALGRQLGALGFNCDFAPVLDVDSNPENPVIGDRSFGADPARVSRHGVAFARGLERGGIASCGKHFPGHGDTELDSHLALPRIAHSLERLEQIELAPFRAASGVLSAVMTAHIVFEAFDAERPATLSPAVLEPLLRDRLGFRGAIVSDDLEMKAVAEHWPVGEAACEAVAAGCDLLLVCSKPELCLEAHAGLTERAEREPAFAERLRAAAARSLELRRRHPLPAPDGQTAGARLLALGTTAVEDRLEKALASRPQR